MNAQDEDLINRLGRERFAHELENACQLQEFRGYGLNQKLPRGYKFEEFRDAYLAETSDIIAAYGINDYLNGTLSQVDASALNEDLSTVATNCLRDWLTALH